VVNERHAHRPGGHQPQPAKDVEAVDVAVHVAFVLEDVGPHPLQSGDDALVVEWDLAAHDLFAVVVAVLAGHGAIPPPLGPAALLVSEAQWQEAGGFDLVAVAEELVPGYHLGRLDAHLLEDVLVVVDAGRAELCRHKVVLAPDGDQLGGALVQPLQPLVLLVVARDVCHEALLHEELHPVAAVAVEEVGRIVGGHGHLDGRLVVLVAEKVLLQRDVGVGCGKVGHDTLEGGLDRLPEVAVPEAKVHLLRCLGGRDGRCGRGFRRGAAARQQARRGKPGSRQCTPLDKVPAR